MSSSAASTVSSGQHKKVLRTRVKVLAKYQLRPSENFDIDKADQLIHRAMSDKAGVRTMMKLYGDGLRFGKKGMGVLSPLQVEFVTYPCVTAFISLRELPTVLALCIKIGQAYGVTVVQFKDLQALQVVCEVIDRQRSLMTGAAGRATAGSSSSSGPAASSISRVEVTTAAAKQPPKLTTPTVIVTTDPEPPAPAAVAVTVTTSEVVSSSSNNGNGNDIFEKRPFTAEITQPPAANSQEMEVANVVVHTSTASATSAAPRHDDNDDDDDDHFRTSIVFGASSSSEEPQSQQKQLETAERQRRMESVLLRAANGGGGGGRSSARQSTVSSTIDAVILNYDDVDTEGTHAVFDSPDGPPIQLNESAVNLRRPESLRVQQTVAAASDSRPRGSRLVVTSFSSGCSDDSPEAPAASGRVHLRSSGEPSYRTSTVIYRDAPSNSSSQLLDSPTDRPRVTYVSNQRASPGTQPSPPYQQHQQPQHQSMQLVRLVPVNSARVQQQQQRRVVQQPTQYYTVQPTGARENGVHLVAK